MPNKTTKEKPNKKEKPMASQETVELVPVVETTLPQAPSDYKEKMTRDQIELVKNTVAKGASDDELKLFLYVCARSGLDPFTKQVHLIPRGANKTIQVGIDGLRSIAERSENYAGNDDPVFDDESKPMKATVTIYKIVQGQKVGFTASARWTQYFPGEKLGFMWKKMPHLMLGKCAEALALRKAFPAVMTGLYIHEEMHQADSPAPPKELPQDTRLEKAIAGIKKDKSVKTLRDFNEKIQKSNYPVDHKIDIDEAVGARIHELENLAPEVETIQVEEDAKI